MGYSKVTLEINLAFFMSRLAIDFKNDRANFVRGHQFFFFFLLDLELMLSMFYYRIAVINRN